MKEDIIREECKRWETKQKDWFKERIDANSFKRWSFIENKRQRDQWVVSTSWTEIENCRATGWNTLKQLIISPTF